MNSYSHKHSRKKNTHVRIITLGSIILLISILILFYFLPSFQLNQIDVSGQQDISASSIRSFVRENFNQWKSHSLFLSTQPLKKNILLSFPEIQTIAIHRRFPRTLVISLVEKKPFLETQVNDLSFLVDQGGFVFKQNQSSHLDIPQLKINFNAFRRPEIGQFLLSNALWGELQPILEHFWKEKEEFHFQEGQLVSSKRLNILLSPGPEIFFDLEQDYPPSLRGLEVLRQQEDFFNLQYIDLRFPNRAYIQ